MANLQTRRSQELYAEACRHLPGGVDSPVRAFKAVGRTPLFIQRGEGARIWDVDGNSYLDYVGSWGPLILGHSHPETVAALRKAIGRGTSFGAPCELEVTLAQIVKHAMPSLEKVRFVNSGTEATMSALRLARAFTGREKIVKFAGCYHGHSDGLLAKAGSGVATLGLPDSPGVPSSYTQHTLVAPYNNLEAVEGLFRTYKRQIAAVILEPVAANMGVVPPLPDFLPGLREITRREDTLLIFDEVITGFRLAFGGAQAIYGIRPDLTCLGKVIGGGLPVGAYGGRKDIMDLVAPEGPVYQAGTLSGNPLAMTAGITTLQFLSQLGIYEELESRAALLARGLGEAAEKAGIPYSLTRAGSILTLFFTSQKVVDYDSARSADTKLYAAFFGEMLERGIYLPPSQFEALFLSLAHTTKDVEDTVKAAEQAFLAMKG